MDMKITNRFRRTQGGIASSVNETPEVKATQEANDAASILRLVYSALKAKGYDPVIQIVGYLISGDPTYITNYQQARSAICRLERDEIMEELVSSYLKELDRR